MGLCFSWCVIVSVCMGVHPCVHACCLADNRSMPANRKVCLTFTWKTIQNSMTPFSIITPIWSIGKKINTLANGYIRYFITSDACDCLKISMVIEIRRELICALQDRLFDGRQQIYGTCKLPVSEGGSPVHCIINLPFWSFLRQNH